MLFAVAVLFIGGAVELTELFSAVEMKVVGCAKVVLLVVDFLLLTGFTEGIFRIRGL